MATNPTIQFDDTIRPTRSHGGASASGVAGGVYPLRSLSRGSSRGRSRRRRGSVDRHSMKSGDVEAAEDEDSGLRQAGDYKERQVFTGRVLMWLAYQSMGVIYGDIGTSPLYVYSSTFTSEPSYDDLVGVLSIIIWSLTMMVTVKYILVILRADNEGEGGTFSCYSLLSRYAHITKRDPREASLIKMERFLSGDLEHANRQVRSGLENSAFARGLLKTIGVLAVSMVMSDGVLTPAQSVLGAVQGLQVVKPDISTATVVGTTCGILVLLFAIQPLGTTRIASAFAPIVIIWLAFNACFGIYNLALFDHSVLKAFSPTFAFQFLIRNKTDGWRMLGGVLLAFTGVEALFADLGAFSRRAIQLSWLCYTFPCLLLAYIGQAAYISVHPGAYSNPFFNAAPPGTLYPSLIIAILAAIVASQAIITATFQLLAQIMKLSYFPQVKVVHTSKTFHGQLYIPFLNWLLMIGTVLVAAIYNNTTSLGNAYGVCVMFVTFFDTCIVSIAALIVWRLNPFLVFFLWLTISSLDGLYLSSALTKVPDGAWFTLTPATVLACLFILWRFGKEQQWQAEASDRFPTSHLVQKGPNGTLRLTEAFGGSTLSTVKGFGIFLDKAGETTPAVFTHFLTKLVAAPEIMVFFHLRPLETPSVAPENRYHVSRLGIPNCYRLIVRHGFMDSIITPDLASLVIEQIRDFLIRKDATRKKAVDRRPGTAEGEKLFIPHPRAEETPDATLTMTATTSSSIDQKAVSEQLEDAEEREDTEHHNLERKITWDRRIEDRNLSETLGNSENSDDKLSKTLASLEAAYAHQILYIIGKEEMRITPIQSTTTLGPKVKSLFRKVLLKAFLWMRDNTRTKIANLGVPTDRLIEVGFVKEV